ncbi:MAG: carboxypeptidase-like regulatory domain-containing protein, partial [Paraprevotella sp.]|nr:carboxypeptidase-like regulatory domain-containing protein [Paraprevotella sp.]
MKMKILYIILYILCAQITVSAQSFTLQGKVTDTNNNPVELATVSVLSQGKVAMTNLKGEFSMRLLSADSVVVRFSMVGYKAKTR